MVKTHFHNLFYITQNNNISLKFAYDSFILFTTCIREKKNVEKYYNLR